MREALETQHLDAVTFGIFDPDAEDFLTEPDEIEEFIDNNNATVVTKAIVDSLQVFLTDLTEAIGKELIDCYTRDD